jgi:hypothetical protein
MHVHQVGGSELGEVAAYDGPRIEAPLELNSGGISE